MGLRWRILNDLHQKIPLEVRPVRQAGRAEEGIMTDPFPEFIYCASPVLVNVRALHDSHPKTIWLPNWGGKGLRIGDRARICASSEHFWVVVWRVDGEIYRGEIASYMMLDSIHKLKRGMSVSFAACNVYEIERRP